MSLNLTVRRAGTLCCSEEEGLSESLEELPTNNHFRYWLNSQIHAANPVSYGGHPRRWDKVSGPRCMVWKGGVV